MGNSINISKYLGPKLMGIVPPASSGAANDPDAQAFITAGSITDATEQAAINELVLELKGQGTINSTIDFWTSFTSESWARIFPFVGGTIDAHKLDLLNPGSNNLIFYGGLIHDDRGITGNGTNGYYEIYGNTNVITTNSIMLTAYVDGRGVFGSYNQQSGRQLQHNVGYNSITTFRSYIMSSLQQDAPDNAPHQGYYSMKTDETIDTQNVKGVYTQHATKVNGNPNQKMTGMGLWYAPYSNTIGSGYMSRTDKWVSITPYINNGAEDLFRTIIDQYQTALGRNH